MSANVLTDPDGNYSVASLPNGSYTITPSKAGYTFTQASRSVIINGAGSPGNDFTCAAVLYAISGIVSGVVIEFISSFNGSVDNPTPGKISIAGTYDLCGGDGHLN